jgi:hypothetical protein
MYSMWSNLWLKKISLVLVIRDKKNKNFHKLYACSWMNLSLNLWNKNCKNGGYLKNEYKNFALFFFVQLKHALNLMFFCIL